MYTSKISIEVKIHDEQMREEWWCVGIYASTDDAIRSAQWEMLEERMKVWGDKWILRGGLQRHYLK